MAAKAGSARVAREDKGKAASGPATRAPEAPVAGLDRLIHERTRLGMVSALAANPTLTFNELKELLRASDGNVSAHARKLEDAGYIHCTKSFAGRVPKTQFKLTAAGRRALEKYLEHMEAVIRAARES